MMLCLKVIQAVEVTKKSNEQNMMDWEGSSWRGCTLKSGKHRLWHLK